VNFIFEFLNCIHHIGLVFFLSFNLLTNLNIQGWFNSFFQNKWSYYDLNFEDKELIYLRMMVLIKVFLVESTLLYTFLNLILYLKMFLFLSYLILFYLWYYTFIYALILNWVINLDIKLYLWSVNSFQCWTYFLFSIYHSLVYHL